MHFSGPPVLNIIPPTFLHNLLVWWYINNGIRPVNIKIYISYERYFLIRVPDVTCSCALWSFVGLFQLKQTGQSIKTQKSSVPAIKSLLAQNLWPCKSRSRGTNTSFKFIDNLHKDFELVYVGQLCLSWEILHWQYKKALELQEFDSQELRQYNQVAGEFQIFQVLLQRFIENEPFQGCTRVLNHVNSRCAHCNFLQVPVIKGKYISQRLCLFCCMILSH